MKNSYNRLVEIEPDRLGRRWEQNRTWRTLLECFEDNIRFIYAQEEQPSLSKTIKQSDHRNQDPNVLLLGIKPLRQAR